MKKLFSTCLGAMVLIMSLWVSVPVLAAPTAVVDMSISDAVLSGDDLLVTVNIALSKPSEGYASLDFYLVSSSYEHLAIASGKGPNDLDITFAQGYGGTSHKGKTDSDGIGYRWLMGIFSQVSGNRITESVEVCTVNLCYRGTAPETLSLKDMTLNYLDGEGKVLSTVLSTDSAKLTIDRSLLSPEPTNPATDTAHPVSSVPTSTAPTPVSTTPTSASTAPASSPPLTGGDDSSFPTVWVIIAVISFIVLAAVTVLWVRQEKKR